MPTQKPQLPSYSLKDLILVGSVVKFALGVTAAILMWQRPGTANNAVNDASWAIAVIMVVQGFLGSVANWVDNRKHEERLHKMLQEMLQERDALWATNSRGNTSSAQLSVTGRGDAVAARHSQDGQANTEQSVTASILTSATTNTDTSSPTLESSTRSSSLIPASGQSLQLSQIKNLGQNEAFIRISGINDADRETQQLISALTQTNITIDVAPSGTNLHSPIFPPALCVSLLSEAKSTNEESGTMNLVTTDINIEMGTQAGQSSSSEELPSPRAGPNTVASGCNSQYNGGADVGQRGMIMDNDPLTTGAMTSIVIARSTLPSARDSSLPYQSENFEVNQRLHATTEGDEAGMQEHVEGTPGRDYVEVGHYQEQRVKINDRPWMTRTTDITSSPAASGTFPLLPGEATEGEKQGLGVVTPETESTDGYCV